MPSEVHAWVRDELERIAPYDARERADLARAMAWVASGAELCRVRKPDVPPMHLVSYCVVATATALLLVDHVNAQLWLPPGGHVDPGEHPRDAARREAMEELGLEATFLADGPVFLTVTETVGRTAGHTDVSLWYLLAGDPSRALSIDRSEFLEARWFRPQAMPFERCDPELQRFVAKLTDRSTGLFRTTDAAVRPGGRRSARTGSAPAP